MVCQVSIYNYVLSEPAGQPLHKREGLGLARQLNLGACTTCTSMMKNLIDFITVSPSIFYTEDQQHPTYSSSSLTVTESASSSESTLSLTLKPKQLEQVLHACNVQIHNLLHMDSLFPHLVQEDLLTQGEMDKLCGLSSAFGSDDRKINYLVEKVLPKKGSTALSRFLKCLECTSRGTAHLELADFIKSKAHELKEDISPCKGIYTCTCTGTLLYSA